MHPTPRALLSALGVLAVTASPAAAKDYADTALNIVPSGQYGAVPPPPGADRQALMYDALTPRFGTVRLRDLTRFFKSAALGLGKDGPGRRETVPRKGVTIVRDTFGVPHITGRTRDDVNWAAGWVMAQDRGLLLEQARWNARVAAVDVPGVTALSLVAGLRNFRPSGQVEAIVARQAGELRRAGRRGRRVLRDVDVYLQGINAWLERSGSANRPWTRNDVWALNALKGQFVGQGGGDEVETADLLARLTRTHGPAKGRRLFDDLRVRDDPESSVSVDGRVAYGAAPAAARATGNVALDAGSFQPVDVAPGADREPAAARIDETRASNVLMVGRERSRTGHPLMVGGPQIGFFYPGLTYEVHVKGPGFETRGVTSAPFPGYVFIGRGQDFAYTLTSASGDIIDVYAEELCGTSRTSYRYGGACREMTRVDAGTLDGAPVAFHQTVHGPVIGYATSGGRPVALARKRSSYGKDARDLLMYEEVNRGDVRSVRDFFRAAQLTPQTFNSFYNDDRDIGMYTSGLLPERPRDVDPALPVRGDGSREWTGFASAREHPQGINPRSGALVNWNNRPQRGFQGNDFAYGGVQRNELLERGIARRRTHDLGTVVAAMNVAATQDPRALFSVPVLARVLRRAPAPSARAQAMLDAMLAWRRRGGSRLDLNGDGLIPAPGAAVLDGSWRELVRAALGPALGETSLDDLERVVPVFDAPPGGMFGGWQRYLDKDLRTLLGDDVRGRYRTRFCGGGDLGACAASLWAALERSGEALTQQHGTPDVARWRTRSETITFVPGLLPTKIRYTNRPSGIQQVISFDGHRPRGRARSRR